MFTVQQIMEYFVSSDVIETMGNWWPRVLAVMSCVIPALYLGFTFVTVGIILGIIWKLVTR